MLAADIVGVKYIVRMLVAALILQIVLLQSSAASDRAAQENLTRCLHADPYCDLSLLTGSEQQRVFAAAHDRHLVDCLAGQRCNFSILDARELALVKQSIERLNMRACLRGNSDCSRSMLTAEQRSEVDRVQLERNFELCVSGVTVCRQDWLSAAQREIVRETYLSRNFAICMQGFEEFTRCNPGELSELQRQQVRARRAEANVYVCRHALLGCDEALLTPEQRAEIDRARPALLR